MAHFTCKEKITKLKQWPTRQDKRTNRLFTSCQHADFSKRLKIRPTSQYPGTGARVRSQRDCVETQMLWQLCYGPSRSVLRAVKLMLSHGDGGFGKSDSWGSFRKLHASSSLDHSEVGSLPESLRYEREQPVWGGGGRSLQSIQVLKKSVKIFFRGPRPFIAQGTPRK